MSEAILEQQDIKNMEAAQTEPETIDQLKSNVSAAYIEMFLALDNLTNDGTKENDDIYNDKFSALSKAERKLSRFLFDQRKTVRESIKFRDPNDYQEDDKVPADPQGQAEEDSYKS
jgi:hypothetical protein